MNFLSFWFFSGGFELWRAKPWGYTCYTCKGARAGQEEMSDPVTVLEVDWCHCDGTRVYATIKIEHCYNRNEDLAPTFGSFCESLATLLVPQDTS